MDKIETVEVIDPETGEIREVPVGELVPWMLKGWMQAPAKAAAVEEAK